MGGNGGMAGTGGDGGNGGMAATGGDGGNGGMAGTGGMGGFGGVGGAPECEVAKDCEPGGECTVTVCDAGMCDTQTAQDGTMCDYSAPSDGTCTGGTCGPTGCVPACVDLDEDDCTEPICPEGATDCSTQPRPEHSECDEGGGSYCDVDGNCAQCTVPRHCNDNEECTDDACTVANMCVNAPKADGEPCSQGGCLGGVCGTVFPCTEQGIRDAIAAGGGPYTFACVGPTTVLTGAEIIINNDVTLDGEGNLTVDGNDDHRVLSVSAGITTELVGMTVTRGRLPQTSEQGGGILNEGTLTITKSTVASNGTPGDDSGGGAEGGGIYNSGTLTLEDSAVRENGAWEGCGIYNTGTATLINSDVSQNGGPYPSYVWSGSGIGSIGTLTLIDTVVTLNEDGGGDAAAINSWGTMTLINSAVLDNVSSQSAAVGSSGSATLINSTVSGNSGGIASGNEIWGGTLTLINSTVVAHQWGLAIDIYGELIATNSIIVGRLPVPPVDHACGFPGGSSTSGGGNIESPGDSCGFDQPTDQVNVSAADLNLSPLADNGGPTMTHALLPGSVAIDWIPEAMCLDAAGDPLTTDQRGEERPVAIVGTEPKCDVGAFEVQP